MPALDPYAAGSRPIFQWDSQPSQPLQFAQTLVPRDQNKPSPPLEQLEWSSSRRKEREKLPTSVPQPPYAHAKHASFDLKGLDATVDGDEADTVGSDEWMQTRVAQCLDSAQHNLDLSGINLRSLSTKIEDLGNLVTLPPTCSPNVSTNHSPFSRSPSQMSTNSLALDDLPHFEPGVGPLAANSRSFSRTVSAPVSQLGRTSLAPPVFPRIEEASENRGLGLMSPESSRPSGRKFGRSKTGAAPFASPRVVSGGRPEIDLNLAGNILTSLPSALFELSNLTWLSLRGNKLSELPAAIGQLRNLKELNIGQNSLTFLPSTILNLDRLERISLHPNEFHRLRKPDPDPSTSDDTTSTIARPTHRTLGPLVSHTNHPVQRLTTILTNFLISPRPPSNHPPLLDYDWTGAEEKGESHPLLDPSILHRRIPCLSEDRLKRILQSLKSASAAAKQNTIKRSHRRTPSSATDSAPDPFPQSHKTSPPDDAALNPYFYPCPSPRHLIFDTDSPRPTKHLFLDPAEERIEWRELKGEKDIPIRWLGCSPGCLAFLEEDEEEEWWEVDEE